MEPDIEQRGVKASRWGAVVSFVISASLIGCGGPKYSGFLRDYSELKPDPSAENALVYRNPEKSLKDYDKFIIERVHVDFAPGAKGARLGEAERKALTDYFRGQLVSGLNKTGRYHVVTAPGPGVMHIWIAITGIKEDKVLKSAYYKQTLPAMRYGGASMEAEGFDSESGERVMAVVDSRTGGRVPIREGMTPLDNARQVIRYWVNRFIKRLDIAHGDSVRGQVDN